MKINLNLKNIFTEKNAEMSSSTRILYWKMLVIALSCTSILLLHSFFSMIIDHKTNILISNFKGLIMLSVTLL